MDSLTITTPGGGGKPDHMTSLEIADLLEARHDSVKRTIERLGKSGAIQLPPLVEVKNHLGQTVQVYTVGERDSYVVVAQLSPEFTAKLVDYWQKHRHEQPAIPTTAQAFASVFQMVADQERQQAAHSAAIQALGERVERVAQAHVVLDKLPSDCEYITVIRKRIGLKYGLSETTVDKVMRNTPYAPTIRALVKNQHVDAEGAHNAGFSKKEVTAIFKRFVDECQMVTETMATHPYIEGRFKLTGKVTA